MPNVVNLTLDTLMLSNTVSAQYKAADLLRNLNSHYDDIVAYIWSVDGSWRFDEGVDYLPIGETNLVKDQADYQLPSTARRIHKVEILDRNGNTRELTPLSEKQQPTDQKGDPTSYKMVGRSIILSPVPEYNYTKGLIIYMSKSVTQLVDGTDEPKIDREFHRYIVYGATRDWYFAKTNITKKREMEREMDKMKLQIKDFYGQRHTDYDAKIKPKLENYQ